MATDDEDSGLVPLQDSSGQVAQVTPQDAATLWNNAGYTALSPQQLAEQQKQDEFGTTSQQLLTGLEGAGEGATFGLSTGLEKAIGVDPENIRARREVNPGSHMLGQIAGIAGSSFLLPGGGEAGLLKAAGEGGAQALGLGAEGAGALSQIGSSAVKNAIETMMVTGGDEVSKMFAGNYAQQNPGDAVETALSNVGLSGLIGAGIGGGIGSVSPLWNATVGPKIGGILNAIKGHVGGAEAGVSDAMGDALASSGMDVTPEIKAGLSDSPHIQNMFKTLEQSDTTTSGQALQESVKNFRSQAADAVLEAIGKTPEDAAGIGELSPFESGKELQKTLISELKEKIDPISEKFNQVSEKFKATPLPETAVPELATKVGQLAQDEGYNLSPSSKQAAEVNRVLAEIPNLKSLEDLRKYQSVIADNTSNPELYRVGKQLKSIFRDAEGTIVEQQLGAESPELLAAHKIARTSYAQSMGLLDSLNDRLHVGKYSGPGSFLKALGEMEPEVLLKRIGQKNDGELLQLLQSDFPQTSQGVKNYQLNDLMKNAALRAPEGQSINPKSLFTAMDSKMSPEYRKFLFTDQAMQKLDAIRAMTDHFDAMPHNFSNTARTVDKLWSYLPGSAIGMATMLSGHNPAVGFLLGGLTKVLGRDVPDAARLGLLKFLGSSEPLEAEGFKSMVDFIQHTIKGENLIGNATKNVFKAGAEVIPQSMLPSDKELDKLDKRVESLRDNPDTMFALGGKTGHYLQPHGMAMAQTASSAVNYLNSLRPEPSKPNPLDEDVEPTEAQKETFHNALTVAEQPLSVLNNVKDGTLVPEDVQHLQAMYPNLYQKLQQKLVNNMIDTIHGEKEIPYETKLSLSLFLAKPLDSTMTPQSIMAAQTQMQMPPQQNQQAGAPKGQGPHSMKNIGSLAKASQTPGQARQANKISQD